MLRPEIKLGAPYWIECALVTRDPAEPLEKTRGTPAIPAAGLSAKRGQRTTCDKFHASGMPGTVVVQQSPPHPEKSRNLDSRILSSHKDR